MVLVLPCHLPSRNGMKAAEKFLLEMGKGEVPVDPWIKNGDLSDV